MSVNITVRQFLAAQLARDEVVADARAAMRRVREHRRRGWDRITVHAAVFADLDASLNALDVALNRQAGHAPDDLCDHREVWEISGDEHRANCLRAPDAARRLADKAGQWDAHGVNGYEL